MYLITTKDIKTCAQGALGALTFGMYHQYTTNKMMEMNNAIEKQARNEMIKEIALLNKQLIETQTQLNKRRWF